MSRSRVLLIVVASVLVLALPVHAEEVQEHPLIRPFPGSVLDPRPVYQNFEEYSFRITDPETGKMVKKPIRGKFWQLTYRVWDSDGKWETSHSILEYRENYKQAALENGGVILYEEQGRLTFTLPGDSETGHSAGEHPSRSECSRSSQKYQLLSMVSASFSPSSSE